MNMTPVSAILTSVLLLLGIRFVFWGTLGSYQSRKAAKRYRADIPLWRRWLMLDAPDYVQDKYSKLERKIIKAKATIRAVRAMNLLLHMLLAAEMLVIAIRPAWCNAAFTIYLLACGACMLLAGVITWCNHPNFERMRHGRKPRNW